MELPKVRRYRKGGIDRLYVSAADDEDLGWAETESGEITVQIPGSRARIEAALEAWAALYPADDLAKHAPGRHTAGLAAAWEAEIAVFSDTIVELEASRDAARHQRDQYLKGEGGERRVVHELNKLYHHGWGILHSIPIFDASVDVDHLMIGPGGVWTVNSKSHPEVTMIVDDDKMTIGRVRVDYIPSARREAAMVASILQARGVNVEVRASLAFDVPLTSTSRIVKAPLGVELVRIGSLLRFFLELPPVLSQDEINQVFAVARKPETWETRRDE